VINNKLREKLLQMEELDQSIRKCGKYSSNVDKNNFLELKKILKKYGWPTYNLVGKKASNAAWLIAQHSDYDIIFQEKCLKLMKKAVNENQADKRLLVYLIDRVLVNNKKKQLYGTQFYTNRKGQFVPRPIKDIKNLDKRRKGMNLESFLKYKKIMNKVHH